MTVRGQREHRPHAELEQREARLDEARAVRQLDDDRVAAYQAEAREAAREAANAREQIAIAQPQRAVDDGERVGMALRAGIERVEERRVLPVAGVTIAAREVVGPVGRVGRHGRRQGGRGGLHALTLGSGKLSENVNERYYHL